MSKEFRDKILAWVVMGSLVLPFIFAKQSHDCRYDECTKLWYEGELGACVESMMNGAAFAIAVGWTFVIFGGAQLMSRHNKHISVYFVMLLVIAFAFFISVIDPAKSALPYSLLPSAIMLGVMDHIDNKDRNVNK